MKSKMKLEDVLKVGTISDVEEKVIFEIIPELETEKGFLQNNPWHIYDVWDHTRKVFQSSKSDDAEIRLALLLHDIGKPHSYQDDENGVRHFRGHAQKSAEMSRDILSRLGYSEAEIGRLCFLIANHDKTIRPSQVKKSELPLFRKLLYMQYCDASGYNPEYTQGVWDRLDKIASELKEKEISNDSINTDFEEI